MLLVEHNAWATDRVLDAAARLTPEQFASEPGPGHAVPRTLLLHLVSATRGWRSRCQGTPLPMSLPESDYQTVVAIRALWEEQKAALQEYVAGLSEDDLDQPADLALGAAGGRLQRGQILTHLLMHNMQHRSEVAQAVTLYGQSPGEIGLFW